MRSRFSFFRHSSSLFKLCSIILLCLLSNGSLAQGIDVFEIFMRSTGGAYPLTVPLRDSVLYPVAYLQPEINRMYQRFWEPDGFAIYEDMEAIIEASPKDRKGITITFKMSPELAKHDPEFGAHSRLAKIMVNFLKNKAMVQNAPIIWSAVTDTGGTAAAQPVKPKFVFGRMPTRVEPIFEDPSPSDSALYNAIKDRPITTSTTTAIEFAVNMFEQQSEGFARVYRPILNFDNLRYGEDASIEISRHPINVDIVVVLFRMNRKAVSVDPNFTQTKKLASGIVKKLKQKTVGKRPDWLKLAAAVDTTSGQGNAILIVPAE